MIDLDVYEAYVKDREEVNACAHCGHNSQIWVHTTKDLCDIDRQEFCEDCGRPWENDVETFEEWAERKGIDV